MTQREAEALVGRFLHLARRAQGKLGTGLDSFVFTHAERRFEAWWLPAIGHHLPGYYLMTHAGPPDAPPSPEPLAAPAQGGSAYRQAPGEAISNPGPAVFRLETSNDRLGRKLGLNRTVLTGDLTFDRRVYTETEAPEAPMRRLLGDSAAREGLLRCLSLGAEAVRLHTGGELSVEVRGLDPKLLSPDYFDALVDALGQAASGMPALRGPVLSPPSAAASARRYACPPGLLLSSLLAIPLFGLLATFAYRHWKPLDDSMLLLGLGWGLLAWLVALPLHHAIERGRPASFRDFLASAGASLIALPLGMLALVLTLNGALDDAPPSQHQMSTRQRWVDRGGRSFGYYVALRSAGSEGPELPHVKVPWGVYRELTPNHVARVTFRRGWLGWRWGVQVEPLSELRAGCVDP